MGIVVLSAVVGAVASVIVLKLLGVDTKPPVVAAAVGAAVGSTVHEMTRRKKDEAAKVVMQATIIAVRDRPDVVG
jgi:uncharacterized membrane protein YjjB (DUF3815 family)